MLLNGTVVLDMEAATLEQVADLTLDHMLNSGALAHDCREKVGCEPLSEIRTPNTEVTRCIISLTVRHIVNSGEGTGVVWPGWLVGNRRGPLAKGALLFIVHSLMIIKMKLNQTLIGLKWSSSPY